MSKDSEEEDKVELSPTEKQVLLALYGDENNHPCLRASEIAAKTSLPIGVVHDALAFLEYVGFVADRGNEKGIS